MHDNGAILAMIIEARLKPLQPQRIAIAPLIGPGGPEQSEAGHQATGNIGKMRSEVLASALAVRYQFLEQQFALIEIEDPQPRSGRWPGIINDRKDFLPQPGTLIPGGTLTRFESAFQNPCVDCGSLLLQISGKRRSVRRDK